MKRDELFILGCLLIAIGVIKHVATGGSFQELLLQRPVHHLVGAAMFFALGAHGLATGNHPQAIAGASLGVLDGALAIVGFVRRRAPPPPPE